MQVENQTLLCCTQTHSISFAAPTLQLTISQGGSYGDFSL